MNDAFLDYSYQFNFPDKTSSELQLKINLQTTTLQSDETTAPYWTALEFNQCPNCPFNKEQHANCPVAQNLIPLLDLSGALISYEAVNVIIKTPERIISADTSIQRAISALLGLIMATSPCPHTEFLKPMARFHLPLASEEETIYRTTSMYLLAQYFRSKAGFDYEIGFEGLTAVYSNLKIINRALASRFRAASEQDATVNAIILLDLLSQAVAWSIEDQLDELQPLFNRFMT
ncbi:MAG: hypothetical protein RQ733_10465 [Methyloprofundus sp.]|nr:hypothetical protein [Methyloprofundus sp.]MDT8426385.1 hypothetical protein [Methyloprofundus sp.]